jgi:hypothetical protein
MVGEIFQYKVFRPGTGEEFDLMPEYDQTLPNMGMFANQGLSAVKSISLTGGSANGGAQYSAQIFPNPSNGIFNLSMNYWPENMKIEIMDATGQLLKQFEPATSQNGASLEINLSHLPDGVYFIKLIDQKFIETKKVIIH